MLQASQWTGRQLELLGKIVGEDGEGMVVEEQAQVAVYRHAPEGGKHGGPFGEEALEQHSFFDLVLAGRVQSAEGDALGALVVVLSHHHVHCAVAICDLNFNRAPLGSRFASVQKLRPEHALIDIIHDQSHHVAAADALRRREVEEIVAMRAHLREKAELVLALDGR